MDEEELQNSIEKRPRKGRKERRNEGGCAELGWEGGVGGDGWVHGWRFGEGARRRCGNIFKIIWFDSAVFSQLSPIEMNSVAGLESSLFRTPVSVVRCATARMVPLSVIPWLPASSRTLLLPSSVRRMPATAPPSYVVLLQRVSRHGAV